jgi:hypothetical protein
MNFSLCKKLSTAANLPRVALLVALVFGFARLPTLHAQGTAFTYQGRLSAGGNVANGNYDVTFALFPTSAAGLQLGGTVTNLNVAVSNGLFTTTIDLGTNFPGADRWLEMGVRTNGNGAFTTLAPRQQLTPTPYAITAGNLSGVLAGNQLSGNYSGGVNFFNPTNSFSGNGGGLTNVNAATVNGLAAASFWQTGGNSNTSPTNGFFLGTKDNQPLEVRVNNTRVFRFESNGTLIGGASNNLATNATSAVIGGGSGNVVSGAYATVPGGNNNSALADNSFAAGQRAKATNQGAFVWADSQVADFTSTTSNQFNVRASGGVRIVTGQTNMTLDGVPVLVGSGVGVLAWQTIGTTTLPAQMHYGYVLTNSQLVTVTLPTVANIGDVFRVSGAGAGGWKIVQNANQSILAGNLNLASYPPLTWTPTSAGNANWGDLTCSADGNKLAAIIRNGSISYSTDGGGSWPSSGVASLLWTNIAASADGGKMVAVAYGGPIYTSANSGASWGAVFGNGNWTCVASSADGTRLAAGILSGSIYISTNSGANWSVSSGSSGFWVSLASSADGNRLVAGQYLGPIFYSANGGASWNTTATPNNFWRSIAISDDGSRCVAGASPGPISVSADGGMTWTATSAPNTTNWSSVACSGDGKKLVAAAQNGPIYVSTDYGVSWSVTSSGNANWTAVASSADGSKLAATLGGGNIYTCQTSAQRTTTIGTAGYLLGGQNSSVELQFIGNNQFIPISHEGTIFAY